MSFSSSLACERTKCLFLNDEPCKVRTILMDLNPVELKYYPFMISLNKRTGSCNVLTSKICVPKETYKYINIYLNNKKYINIKAFNITNKNEAKAMTEHTSCDCKCSTVCNSNQKWNNKIC